MIFGLIKRYHLVKRLFYTLRPLRWRQFTYRFKYIFLPLERFISFTAGNPKLENWVWAGPSVGKQSIFKDNFVEHLNIRRQINVGNDWNDSESSKLWLYNLHYFDDLNAEGSDFRHDLHVEFIERWIKENPCLLGNGWEAYPLSLRLVNWVKWLRRTGVNNQSFIDSISIQAQVLCWRLEHHILGNHLFANAKALVFVGCYFKGYEADRFLNIGLKILEEQVLEQFLDDGGHFELCPMYHSILLWDLLDLINLAQVSNNNRLKAIMPQWMKLSAKAINWLKIMQHPDGEISFFNDSAFGIAASPHQIYDYAESLGIPEITVEKLGLVTLLDSGYSRIAIAKHVLIFDHASVGPDYLPGHAHADTLSFEWSVGRQRVFVNSGTSVYGVSDERLRQRKSAAHNTVVIDNEDSSEVWSGFRVARRAYATLIETSEFDGNVCIKASHDGYTRLKIPLVHTREIDVRCDCVIIRDSLIGAYGSAKAYFHLHPKITPEQVAPDEIRLTNVAGDLNLLFKSGRRCRFIKSTWHPKFGESQCSHKIEVIFDSKILETTIHAF